MESLQRRIDSFSKSVRVKHPSKSTFVSVKWTHPPYPQYAATPVTLAEAGFYFNPSYEDRDNVACFVCDKQLADWEAEDDPFDIHWEKCGDRCCWAIVRCRLRGDINRHGGYTFTDKSRVPTSKAMEKARLNTFSLSDWKHDKVKNHGANSRKMAHAGFVFTPTHPGDDLATCLYCNVSLAGWEPQDDPMEEHRRRQDGTCPMFDTPEPASKPPSRSQSLKPASKSQPSRQARSVSQSHPKHTDLMQPMKTHDGDAAESDAAPQPSSRRSTRAASTSGKGAKASKVSRSQSRSELNDVVEDEDEEVVPRIGRPKAKKSLAPTTKKARSRSKSVAPQATTEDEEAEVEEIVRKAPTKSRSKSKGKEKARVDDLDEIAEEAQSLKKSTRGRPLKKAKQQPEVEMEVEEEDEEEEEEEEEEVKVLKKSTRGRAQSRIGVTEEDAGAVIKAVKKSSRSKPPSRVEEPSTASHKTSRAKKLVKAPEVEDDADVELEEDTVEEERKPRMPSKSRAKTPAPRKPSRAKPKNVPASAGDEPEDDQDVKEEEEEEDPKKQVLSTAGLMRAPSIAGKTPSASLESTAVRSGKTFLPQEEAHEDDSQDELGEDLIELPPRVETKKRAPSSSTASVPNQPQSKVGAKAPAPPSALPPDKEADDTDEDDQMDVFVSPRQSPVPPPPPKKQISSRNLPQEVKDKEEGDEPEALFIPKRGEKPLKPAAQPSTRRAEETYTEDAGMREPVIVPKRPVNEARPHALEVSKPMKEAPPRFSGMGGLRKASILKVVEISTDEEGSESEGEKRPTHEAKPKQTRTNAETRISQNEVVERVKVAALPPPKPPIDEAPFHVPTPLSRSPPPSHSDTEDFKMGDIEPEAEPFVETQPADIDPPPQTPPRSTATVAAAATAPEPLPTSTVVAAPATNPPSIPALSKLPFTPVQNLTDAELNMTVEEWIRYQMEVEYDKFRRDGEREIGRFKKRAEEVKGIIENL